MTGPTHVVVGFAATVVLARTAQIPLDIVSLAAVFLGSLAPDIDGDGTITRPGRLLRNFVPRLVGAVLDAVAELVTETAEKIFGHRGFFHWPILGISIAAYGFHSDRLPVFWFGWAYLSHILADALTVRGVPLFAPLSRKNINLGFVRTGSMFEALFAAGVFSVMTWYGISYLPAELQRSIQRLLEVPRP